MSEAHEVLEETNIFRRYQRPLMLALTIFCLLTFSITGAALMIFDDDPSQFAIVTPAGHSAKVGGRADADLTRSSRAIVLSVAGSLYQLRTVLDRAEEESFRSNQRLQAVQELREFDVWLPFFDEDTNARRRRRSDQGVPFDDYAIFAGAARAEGIRIPNEALDEKTQALLQLVRAGLGDRGAEFGEDELPRQFGLTASGFRVALEEALAATEMVRRLELALEVVPSPTEVEEGWREMNPVVSCVTAVFATSFYEEEARKLFELLFPTEEERKAEIARWRADAASTDSDDSEVDAATSARREKILVEVIDPMRSAAEDELAQASEALEQAGGKDEALSKRVRAAQRKVLDARYLEEVFLPRRTTYTDDPELATADSLRDFEARRWVLFGLDLDAITAEQEAHMLAWLVAREVEAPELKDVAAYFRDHGRVRFRTEEGRLSNERTRIVPSLGGAAPRTSGGTSSGSIAHPGVPAAEGVQDPTGPAPAVPEGMLARSDRPDFGAQKDNFDWDDPGIQERARRDLVAKLFLERYRTVVVDPAVEAATKAERVVVDEKEKALDEATQSDQKLTDRFRELNAQLTQGSDGRGMQRYGELRRILESNRALAKERAEALAELEQTPAAERGAEFPKRLEESQRLASEAAEDRDRAAAELHAYLAEGFARVSQSLLAGRATGVASALQAPGFGTMIPAEGEKSPAEAATESLAAVWNALDAAEKQAAGGAAAWDGADARARLGLLVQAIGGKPGHPQAGALQAAWRAWARASLAEVLAPLETQRRELQGKVEPALQKAAETVDRIQELTLAIPAADAFLGRLERTLAERRSELGQASGEQAKQEIQADIDSLESEREAKVADRSTKADELTRLQGEEGGVLAAWVAARDEAFAASAGWSDALAGIEERLRAIEAADPAVASLAPLGAAVDAARTKLEEAEAAGADVTTIDRLQVDLLAKVEQRLQAYERGRSQVSVAETRGKLLRDSFADWRAVVDPAAGEKLREALVEMSAWGELKRASGEAVEAARAELDAAKAGLDSLRTLTLTQELERLSKELRESEGAAGLDLVVQTIPAAEGRFVTKDDLRQDYERFSSDMAEGGMGAILETALFGPGGQLAEGELAKNLAISPRYAYFPGLLDAGGPDASDRVAKQLYLRSLARDMARVRAAIFSEMLDAVERIDDEEADERFAAGSPVTRDDFENELREGSEYYLVPGDYVASGETRFQGTDSYGFTYYQWRNTPANPNWFRSVTHWALRRLFDEVAGSIEELEDELLSSQPVRERERDAFLVSLASKRPLDPEAAQATPSAADWLTTFRRLQREKSGEAIRNHLAGDGLRKLFQVER